MEAYNPGEIYRQLLDAGEDWADRKAAYEALSDQSKSVLSKIKEEHESESDAKATAMALRSRWYLEHLDELAKARSAYLHAQVKYDSMKTLSDHVRTKQSNIRAEMKHIV